MRITLQEPVKFSDNDSSTLTAVEVEGAANVSSAAGVKVVSQNKTENSVEDDSSTLTTVDVGSSVNLVHVEDDVVDVKKNDSEASMVAADEGSLSSILCPMPSHHSNLDTTTDKDKSEKNTDVDKTLTASNVSHEDTNGTMSSSETVQVKTVKKRLGLSGPQTKKVILKILLKDLKQDIGTKMNVNESFTVDMDNDDKAIHLLSYGCNKCKYTCYTLTGYETHMFHSHRVRNVDKYPPTLIKKMMAAPSSHEVTSSDDADKTIQGDSADKSNVKAVDVEDDESEVRGSENSAVVECMEEDGEGSGSLNLAQVDAHEASDHEGHSKSETVYKATSDENGNEIRNEDDVQGTEGPRNRQSTFSTEHAQMKMNFFCDQCDASFIFKSTYETHAKEHLDEVRPFKCSYCPEAFFYQGGLTHHEAAHEHQIENNGEVYGIDRGEKKTDNDSTRGRKRTRGRGQAVRYRSENSVSRKSLKLAEELQYPRRFRGKLIKTPSDMDTSEDSMRRDDGAIGMQVLMRMKEKKKNSKAVAPVQSNMDEPENSVQPTEAEKGDDSVKSDGKVNEQHKNLFHKSSNGKQNEEDLSKLSRSEKLKRLEAFRKKVGIPNIG